MATTQKNQNGNGRQSGQHSQNRSGNSNSGNFVNMDDNKQREIASKGGKSSHASGSGNKSH